MEKKLLNLRTEVTMAKVSVLLHNSARQLK
jgi:hypothetical protein